MNDINQTSLERYAAFDVTTIPTKSDGTYDKRTALYKQWDRLRRAANMDMPQTQVVVAPVKLTKKGLPDRRSRAGKEAMETKKASSASSVSSASDDDDDEFTIDEDDFTLTEAEEISRLKKQLAIARKDAVKLTEELKDLDKAFKKLTLPKK
jgi:hypothetical protein